MPSRKTIISCNKGFFNRVQLAMKMEKTVSRRKLTDAIETALNFHILMVFSAFALS